MLIGTAVGDALGSTIEGKPLGAKYKARLDPLPRGSRITDDTQLSFWGVEVFLAKGWLDPALLAERYSRERIIGIGGTVKRFLSNYKDNGVPWFLSGVPSAGNGAVMRLPPVIASSIASGRPRIGPEAVVYTAPIYRDPFAHAAAYALSGVLWNLANNRLTLAQPETIIDYYLDLHSRVEAKSRYTLRAKHKTFQGQGWEIIEAVLRDADKRRADPAEFTRLYGSWAYLAETMSFTLYLILNAQHYTPHKLLECAAKCSQDSDTIAAIMGAVIGAAGLLHKIPIHLIEHVKNRLLPARFRQDLERLTQVLTHD